MSNPSIEWHRHLVLEFLRVDETCPGTRFTNEDEPRGAGLLVARMRRVLGYCEVISHHIVRFETIPKSHIKWV